MIKYFLIIAILLLPNPAWSWLGPANPASPCVVGAVAAGECATGTTDVEYDYTGGASALTDAAIGRTFIPTQSKNLYSIWIYIGYASAGSEVEVRWGTTADLTTYVAAKSQVVTTASWNEFIFETKGNVTASATYYIGLAEVSGDARIGYLSTGGPGKLTASSAGFNLDGFIEGWNISYKVDLCD